MSDGDEVLSVALKAEHTDAAVAALERITSAEELTAIAQRARNKVAGRRARARLRVIEEAAQPAVPGTSIRMSTEDRRRAQDLLHGAEGIVAVTDPAEAGHALARRGSRGLSCRPTSRSTARLRSSSSRRPTRGGRRSRSGSRSGRRKRSGRGPSRASRRIVSRSAKRSWRSRAPAPPIASPS